MFGTVSLGRSDSTCKRQAKCTSACQATLFLAGSNRLKLTAFVDALPSRLLCAVFCSTDVSQHDNDVRPMLHSRHRHNVVIEESSKQAGGGSGHHEWVHNHNTYSAGSHHCHQ